MRTPSGCHPSFQKKTVLSFPSSALRRAAMKRTAMEMAMLVIAAFVFHPAVSAGAPDALSAQDAAWAACLAAPILLCVLDRVLHAAQSKENIYHRWEMPAQIARIQARSGLAAQSDQSFDEALNAAQNGENEPTRDIGLAFIAKVE
jgi:hypothetical protein